MLCIGSAVFSEIARLVQLTEAQEKSDFIPLWEAKDKNKEKILMAPLGVGYLTAAIHLQQLLHRYPDVDRFLFSGTAGIYPETSHYQIGDLALCQDTLLSDAAVLCGFSKFAPPLLKDSLSSTLPLDYPSVRSARVVTLLSLTKSAPAAKRICSETEGELENMELYGIAQVCQSNGIEWNAFLGLTNFVGPEGSLQWFQNHQALEEKSGNLLFERFFREKELE